MKIRLKPEKENKILHKITETISCNLDLEEVLKQIVEIVIQTTKGDSCLVYLFDARREELTLHASKNPHPRMLGKIRIKLGEGITGWVARERKPVAIPRNAGDDPRFKFFNNLPEDKYQAFLSVPIINRNEIIGVVNVQHKRAHEHSPNEIALLATIARQVGYAIENARLYEEAKRRAGQLKTLAEVSQTIASNRYLKEILQLVATMTAEMMNSKMCSIMLLDEKSRELVIEVTQGLGAEYLDRPPLRSGEGISGRAAEEKRPFTVLDATRDPGYKFPRMAKQVGICSMLAVPMLIRDKTVGIINTYTAAEHRFSEEEIRILQSVANQAAVAIENTKLMEEALVAREALETRKSVERAKGILMKELGLDEEKAYRMMRGQSMDSGKPMKEIAEAIRLSSELKKRI